MIPVILWISSETCALIHADRDDDDRDDDEDDDNDRDDDVRDDD